MEVVGAKQEEDLLPVLETYIKVQRIRNVYVDVRAQVKVMSEKMMHRLGLEFQGKSEFKANMANNISVKCIKSVKGLEPLCVG